jgi:UDP-glucose 4-epimerase
MVEEVVKYKVHRKYLIARPYDVPVSVLDNTLAAQELNWRPRTQLPEGLLRTFRWMRNNIEKC